MSQSMDVAITKKINDRISQIVARTEEEAQIAMWNTLKEIQPLAQTKFRSIIYKQFYQGVPETDYYDRTLQMLNLFEVKITQGGGHYVLSVFYKPNNVATLPPARSGAFWSYGYSWGEGLVGKRISDDMIIGIAEEIEETYHLDYESEFEEWMEKTFPALFEKNFRVRTARIK